MNTKAICTACLGTKKLSIVELEDYNCDLKPEEQKRTIIDCDCCNATGEIELKWEPINEETIGDLITINTFIEYCMDRCLINYDGWGYLSTKEKESNLQI